MNSDQCEIAKRLVDKQQNRSHLLEWAQASPSNGDWWGQRSHAPFQFKGEIHMLPSLYEVGMDWSKVNLDPFSTGVELLSEKNLDYRRINPKEIYGVRIALIARSEIVYLHNKDMLATYQDRKLDQMRLEHANPPLYVFCLE